MPFGLGAAIFISEFCGPRVKETLKVVIELLAAIPVVVWGFIGLTVMSRLIMKHLPRADRGERAERRHHPGADERADHRLDRRGRAQGGAGFLPRGGAGAGRRRAGSWSTACCCRRAKNGLLAAVLLGVGRAVGETMAVLMATGHAVNIPTSVLDSVRTLTATIAAELGEAPVHSDHYQVLFIIGVLLFTITFVVNLTADLIVRGIRSAMTAPVQSIGPLCSTPPRSRAASSTPSSSPRPSS